MSITFETKCWEHDWMYLLKEGYLEKMIDNCNYNFDERVLFINNVNDLSRVEMYAQKKIDQGVIDRYVIVDKYAKEVLSFFQISKDDFKGGYYYSIAELTSIFLCETDLLLHFSGDSLIKENNNWVEKSIKLLTESNDYFVSNPVWENDHNGVRRESIKETDEIYVGYGFSDQCYMVRTTDFKNAIYHETNLLSERYPKYGGELFEKRVDSYMRNHNLLRVTSKCAFYQHKNYKKRGLIKRIIDNNFYI
ncbi:hypothetical protein [Dysgonomonas sp. ZJ279]|uniref:hypothetical protein n=1 Tax=Dysgonomonas sp. ZJ279 TaxID=2709796 RepID=UPI0013ECD57E|nr:hypothetical protein [Dysgonomonas sp. ZJ279]